MATRCSCLREGIVRTTPDPFCLAPSHLYDQLAELERELFL